MRLAAWMLPVALVASGCAARVFTPPTGPAEPFADAPAVWNQVTTSCRDAQRYVAELRVRGWVGARDQGISSTIKAGVSRNDDVILEMQVILGTTVLQMAGRQGQATVLLPRHDRVLRAPTRDIVGALTGLQWGGRELLEVLSGCVATPEGEVTGARIGGSLRVDLSPSSRAWLRQRGGQWQLEAAQIHDWTVQYGFLDSRWPTDVRVTSTGAMPLDLRFTVSQINVNIDLPPEAFTLDVPERYLPMTLDELRSIGPLRDRGTMTDSSMPITDRQSPIVDKRLPIPDFRLSMK